MFRLGKVLFGLAVAGVTAASRKSTLSPGMSSKTIPAKLTQKKTMTLRSVL